MARSNVAPAPETVTLHVKNMVCNRCIRVVREELRKIGIDVRDVQLGEVVVAAKGLEKKLDSVEKVLEENGFELIDDKKAQLVEQIKTVIISLIHHSDGENTRLKYSQYLAQKMGYEYHHLSKLFSSIENVTIERFIILQKIERVKELLVYGEITLSEIAYRLRYSSVQHLSNQFKQVTGFTPTAFQRIKGMRKPLDQVAQT